MNPVGPAVVAIAGPIGSGKTTTATLLAQQMAWPQAGYGDTIRAIAAGRGLPVNRQNLQELGLDLISRGWDAFTVLVLQHARWVSGQPLVLDGLRHPGAAAALRTAVTPLSVIIVYLDLPADIAAARARCRDQDAGQPFSDSAAHATELDLPGVREMADLAISARPLTSGQVTSQIASYLESVLSHDPGGRCA